MLHVLLGQPSDDTSRKDVLDEEIILNIELTSDFSRASESLEIACHAFFLEVLLRWH